MSMIHPTAIIHPDAEIAEGVSIGPYACIEGPAKIGENTAIHAHAILSGPVTLGERNVIGHGAIIGTKPQDLSFDPETTTSGVVIGNDNTIREYATIHRASKDNGVTSVGNQNFIMAGAHLGHDVCVGNHVVIANNVLLAGHIQVGDRAFLGGGGVFHQFIRIGRLAITQGGIAAGKDIPPFTVAVRVNRIAGINTIGLKRNGFGADQRHEIKAAFQLLYLSGLNVSQALARARESEWGPEATEFFEFVASAKKRGICAVPSR